MIFPKIDARLPRIEERCFTPRVAIEQIEYFESEKPLTVRQVEESAAFEPIAIGHLWGRPWTTAWFRYRFAIPQAMKGRTVFVFLDDGGEGVCYLDGVPLQGLDVNHREIRLVEQAEGNEVFELYVESVPQSSQVRFHGPRRVARAEIGALIPQVWALYHDLRVLTDLARQLPEGSTRRSRILYSVNHALNRFDYDTEDPEALTEAAAACRELLQPLLTCRAAASAQRFGCVGHAHIDCLWLWPFDETVRKCARTFSTAVRLMEEYPEYLFAQSQPHLYALTRKFYPELYEKIRSYVAAGQWQPTGAFWIECDCNMTSGESFIRQIALGKRFFKSEFNIEPRVAWLPDTFGFCATLPQILAQSGIEYMLTQKLSWGTLEPFPYDSFWWEGLDGSRVFCHFPPTDNYNCRVNAEEMLRGERQYVEKDRAQSQIYIYGYGDGGGGPTRAMLECLRRARDLEGLPRCEPTAPDVFFNRLRKESGDFPVWVGELYYAYHRGTYTTQARTKLNNRRSEILLHDAEAWSALAAAGCGFAYPAETLREAWQRVCLCQFHDVLPGSSIGQVYREVEGFYAEAREKGAEALDAALDCLANRIETGTRPGNPVVVFNSLGWLREGPIHLGEIDIERLRVIDAGSRPMRVQKAEDGWLFWAEDVPSYGYKTFWYDEGTAVATEGPEDEPKATERSLENRYLLVELDDAGELRRVFDKEAGRDVLADGETGNQLRLFEDIPHNWDAWEIDPDYREKMWPVGGVESIEVVERGPVRVTLRVRRKVGRSTIEQTVVLWARSRRIDFETEIDWQESHKMLKAAFPLAVRAARATFETAFGHVERPTHANRFADAMMFEVPAHRWADLGEDGYGVALLNDCKYGYDARGNVLSLTLLRSPKDPDPQADMGRHRLTYALVPHAEDFRRSGVIRHGYELNIPLRARRVQTARMGNGLPVEQGLVSIDVPNVVVETVKQCDRGPGLIVRLYEAWGRRGPARLSVALPFKRAERVDLMEEPLGKAAIASGAIDLQLRPFEIATVRLF